MAKLFSPESPLSNGVPEILALSLLQKLLAQPDACQDLAFEQANLLSLLGAIYILRADQSPAAVEILRTAVIACPVALVRQAALDVLAELAHQPGSPACDALFSLAIFDNCTPARDLVRKIPVRSKHPELHAVEALLSENPVDYQQRDSNNRLISNFYFQNADFGLQQRMLASAGTLGLRSWITIISALDDTQPDRLEALLQQFGAFSEAERALALDVLNRAAGQGSLSCREALCRLFIDYEYQPAKSAALAQGYAPAAPEEAALFYFLSEQWQIYEYLDFNQSLLAAAYEKASPNLRQRILFLSRYVGRTEWMKNLSSVSRQRWLWDLNDADWELAVRNLRVAQQYADLWRLAQVASPAWSAQILSILHDSGWIPDHLEDRVGLEKLLELQSPLLQNPPPVSMLQTWRSPSPDITSLAVSQDGSYLAVGGSNSTIHTWAIFKSPSPLPPLIGPVQQTRALAYSPDGEYLAAANGDHAIRAYRLSDGKLVKSLEGHTGLVRALAFSPDSRSLISASFDGSLRAWRFPQGPEVKALRTGKTELFCVTVSPDGQIILSGGADQCLHVFRWPDGDPLWQLQGHTSTITALTAAPKGQLAASASRDGKIFIWNYIAGRPTMSIAAEELITVLAFHPNEQFILAATAQGNVGIWNVTTGKKVFSESAHSHPVSGMAIAPDGHQFFTSSTMGTLSAWDLQLFTWSRTPIGSNRSQTLAQVEQRARQASQKPAERAWLHFIAELIRWRQRFDVEIEETHPVISVGEFDIEL